MGFLRNLFSPDPTPSADTAPRPAGVDPAAETATVRRIVESLEALPREQARLIACAAYVVTRAANADMDISDEETRHIEEALQEQLGLEEAQAVLVVEMAKMQTRTIGGTEDFLVTREFRNLATLEQRQRVLRACFVVTAIDDSITALESATVNQIANELGIEGEDLARLRGEFTEQFSAIQAARQVTDPG